MNFINTSSVNNGIKTDTEKYITLSENIYLSQIKEAAEKICADRIRSFRFGQDNIGSEDRRSYQRKRHKGQDRFYG